MSRQSRLRAAFEHAYQSGSHVLVFGGWRPLGSIAAWVATLLARDPVRLAGVPLNVSIGLVPLTWIDEGAFSHHSVRIRRVADARNRARVKRSLDGTAFPGDLVNSDWDYAARTVGREAPSTAVGIGSCIALDSVDEEGTVRKASRPVLGHRVIRGCPRLPRVLGLRTRCFTEEAVETVLECDVLIVDLTKSRGTKTSRMIANVLEHLPERVPTLLVAETPSEVTRYRGIQSVDRLANAVALSPAFNRPTMLVRAVNQVRAQHEQDFRFAIPTDVTGSAEALLSLGRAAWRSGWRGLVGYDGPNSPLARFESGLGELRRQDGPTAAQFSLLEKVLQGAIRDQAASADERLAAVLQVGRELRLGSVRSVVVVSSSYEVESLKSLLHAHGMLKGTDVLTHRQQTALSLNADVCVVAANYGPTTVDAALRSQSQTICLIADPVEISGLAFFSHTDAELLKRSGLLEEAACLGRIDGLLCKSIEGLHTVTTPDDHPELFRWHDRRDEPERLSEATEDAEVIGANPDLFLLFASGSKLVVEGSRKFDVLGRGSPNPRRVAAEELKEGDLVLVVKGTHQKTLSELLLEDMDGAELRLEADKRKAWVRMVRALTENQRLTPSTIGRRMRQAGHQVTTVRITSWLRGDDEETTPRERSTFMAFAQAVGVVLPNDVLMEFYDAIRQWRVGHRKRGREVIRTLRLAWYGGLSASDRARIQQRWGLSIRDLLEGCRVDELELIRKLTPVNKWTTHQLPVS